MRNGARWRRRWARRCHGIASRGSIIRNCGGSTRVVARAPRPRQHRGRHTGRRMAESAAEPRGPCLGADGLAMLLVAIAVGVLSLGPSLVAAVWQVAGTARAGPGEAPPRQAIVLGLRLPRD